MIPSSREDPFFFHIFDSMKENERGETILSFSQLDRGRLIGYMSAQYALSKSFLYFVPFLLVWNRKGVEWNRKNCSNYCLANLKIVIDNFEVF